MVSVTRAPQRGTAAPGRTAWTFGQLLEQIALRLWHLGCFPRGREHREGTHGQK